MATGSPRLDRYGYGFFAWKAGVNGMAQWVYRGGNVYDQAYGLATAYVFPATDGKPLPTIHWEAIRQAFIDQRYGATLTRLVDFANGSGDAEAKAAASHAVEAIKDVLGQFRLGYMDRRFPAGVRREFYLHAADGSTFDTCRWRIAQHIMKLRATLGGKAAPNPKDKASPLAPAETMFD